MQARLLNEDHETREAIKRKKSWWDWIIEIFAVFSELSNIGIVINMASQWFKPLLSLAGGALSSLVFYTDPLIYCFKSLIRLTKIVGRTCFNVQFEEEAHGVHQHQTKADAASLILFGLAIMCFVGAIIAPPVGITVAWAFALSGLSIVGHFDYAHQEKLAKKHYEDLRDNPFSQPKMVEDAKKEYIAKRNSKRLFYGLLIGLTVLLLCGSAAVFAPPALAPILYIMSKIASTYLTTIAVGRFANWACPEKVSKVTGLFSRLINWLMPDKDKTSEPSDSPSHAPLHSPHVAESPSYKRRSPSHGTSSLPLNAIQGIPLISLDTPKTPADQKVVPLDQSLTQCRATHFSQAGYRPAPLIHEATCVSTHPFKPFLPS